MLIILNQIVTGQLLYVAGILISLLLAVYSYFSNEGWVGASIGVLIAFYMSLFYLYLFANIGTSLRNYVLVFGVLIALLSAIVMIRYYLL